ncbi:MAG: tyrosine--tRNA ligase [Actinomycetota bacterium]|nr:tyrosine--tRNA ligase [Actinomycetota bacterium]MDQ6946229.1 tyrosine--tRNA ligase [Actinomycetota bacterium]
MPTLSEDLRRRGLIHQMTHPDLLSARLDGRGVVGYIGFDPTADSLHVGHLQQICLLRRLAEAGHRPIALVGGGTGMIGDPSGRSEERNLLDVSEIATNSAGVAAQLGRFLDFGPERAILVDNIDWLGQVALIDFLREVGKMFSVNEMVRRDSVRTRLEGADQTLSFTEFSYMLLMAWDYVQLFDRYNCTLQLGGSDQWGNITEGIDLVRRSRGSQVFGLTSPLVTKADGTKFGKTATGTVWLDASRTSAYQFFQFWFGAADHEVGSFLRRFTFLELDELDELDRLVADRPERRDAQRTLARHVTALVHGAEEAARAERAAEVLFTEDVATLDLATLVSALANAPTTTLDAGEVTGMDLVDALTRSGLSSSRRDARQQLGNGAVWVNNRRQGEGASLSPSDLLHGRYVILRRGRRTMHVLAVS